MTFGWRSSLNLLTCNIWTEPDCTTNLFTDYHKLINYEVMMCPNGLIIAFSQTDHIVPCGRRLPHIFSKKKKSCSLDAFYRICCSDTCDSVQWPKCGGGNVDILRVNWQFAASDLCGAMFVWCPRKCQKLRVQCETWSSRFSQCKRFTKTIC